MDGGKGWNMRSLGGISKGGNALRRDGETSYSSNSRYIYEKKPKLGPGGTTTRGKSERGVLGNSVRG